MVLLLVSYACRPAPRSAYTFEEAREAALGRSKAEVLHRFGSPSSCEPFLADSEVCTWERFTQAPRADGVPRDPAPVVDLEITFVCPAGSDPRKASHDEWRAIGPLAVNYSVPSSP